MKEEDVFDRQIWALLSGQINDPKVTREVAQILNDEFIPKVMGVLKKYGVDETTAEEIAKTAVDKAVKTYQPGKAKFLTFVTRIALNVRVDKFRQGLLPSQALKSLNDDALEPQEILSVSPSEIDPPEESEFVKKVNSIVPALSQEDRVLIQFDIQGVPKESYMQIYGISEVAYRQRKLRAYERMRDLFNHQ